MSREIGSFPGVARRLIEARNRLQLTQKEMAQHLDISIHTYMRSEQDQRAMDIDELARLAELGIDIGWLLTGVVGVFARSAGVPDGLDPDILGRITDGLVNLYNEENQRIAGFAIGEIAAQMYPALASIEDDVERRGALRYALEIHRAELRKVLADPGSSKLRA